MASQRNLHTNLYAYPAIYLSINIIYSFIAFLRFTSQKTFISVSILVFYEHHKDVEPKYINKISGITLAGYIRT